MTQPITIASQSSGTFKVSRINKLANPTTTTLAFADVLINDCVIIKGWRVVKGKNGPFVSIPQDKGSDKKWYGRIFFPNLNDLNAATKEVLLAYNM